MRAGVILGLLGGLAGGALQVAAMFTRLPYEAWDRANTALFVAFTLAVIVLGAWHGRGRRVDARLIAPVAAAVLLSGGIALLTYAVATGPFADQVRQLPFFERDVVFRGYPSARAYLVPEGNYGALFRLRMFIAIVVALLQLALGGAAAGAASVTRARRASAGPARTSATDGS